MIGSLTAFMIWQRPLASIRFTTVAEIYVRSDSGLTSLTALCFQVRTISRYRIAVPNFAKYKKRSIK